MYTTKIRAIMKIIDIVEKIESDTEITVAIPREAMKMLLENKSGNNEMVTILGQGFKDLLKIKYNLGKVEYK